MHFVRLTYKCINYQPLVINRPYQYTNYELRKHMKLLQFKCICHSIRLRKCFVAFYSKTMVNGSGKVVAVGAFAFEILTDWEFIEIRFKEFNQGSSSILLLLFSSIRRKRFTIPVSCGWRTLNIMNIHGNIE